jgi:hypothetical protein
VPIELNANHRDMVKFPSGNEARGVMTEIVNMIKKKLNITLSPASPDLHSGNGLPVLIAPGYELNKLRVNDDNSGFSQLASFDTVFVIDDTGSMQMASDSAKAGTENAETRWDVLTRSMQYIGNIAAEYDEDGVDIRFLKSTNLNHSHIKSGQEVLNLLAQVDLEKGVGGTKFATILAHILGPYVARYEKYFEAMTRQEQADMVKPLNIIVLTDGKSDDPKATKKTIINMGMRLDKIGAPLEQVGIQFLQVGDDQEAAKWLRSLDDELEAEYGIRDVSLTLNRLINMFDSLPVLLYLIILNAHIIEQYVDTRTFRELNLSAEDFVENLREILLGAIDREID